mmetsp:Transcript_3709/g.11515  ORF Transcript_3709/g.11515 Transcript_3709/m.11515 type:complete len:249 (+) Transcript_3709:89-835(+)
MVEKDARVSRGLDEDLRPQGPARGGGRGHQQVRRPLVQRSLRLLHAALQFAELRDGVLQCDQRDGVERFALRQQLGLGLRRQDGHLPHGRGRQRGPAGRRPHAPARGRRPRRDVPHRQARPADLRRRLLRVLGRHGPRRSLALRPRARRRRAPAVRGRARLGRRGRALCAFARRRGGLQARPGQPALRRAQAGRRARGAPARRARQRALAPLRRVDVPRPQGGLGRGSHRVARRVVVRRGSCKLSFRV